MLDILFSALIALLLLAAATYAQRQIPIYTKPGSSVIVARVLLVIVGIGLGLISASYVERPVEQVLGFLTGFGFVHVPAAIVLFVKSRRGEGRS